MDKDLARGTLESLLCTINGLEGLDDGPTWHLVNSARRLLEDFLSHLYRNGYKTDEDLAFFDPAFTKAGWDDQGIRTTEAPYNNLEIRELP